MKCYRLKILVRFPNGIPRDLFCLIGSWESMSFDTFESCLRFVFDVETTIGISYGDFYIAHFRRCRGLCVHKRILLGYSSGKSFAVISIVEEKC